MRLTQKLYTAMTGKAPGTPAKRSRAKVDQTARINLFNAQCRAHGLPLAVPEHSFHPTRGWRFDWAWVEGKTALEVEGFGKKGQPGRHQRIKGFLGDMEKYNEAELLGWTVLRCTNKDIKSGAAFALVARALGTSSLSGIVIVLEDVE